MQAGLVSVMMPAYNAERYIGQAIESVLAQTYAHWELVIVNDGSTDSTAAIANQFTDSRIRIIHQANGGESVARNTALQHMQGEYIAFLDADDIYLPDHLATTVNYLQSHLDRDGVYTDGYYCDENGVCLKSLASRRRGPFEGRVFEQTVYASDVFGPPVCVVLRHAIIVQHDLAFDEDIIIGPDWVFFTQYADVVQFGYVDQSTCHYRVHQTNITNRIGLQKRAVELAKCRIKMVKMPSFHACSSTTRTAVFYDLLVNLLRDFPERLLLITQWPEFSALPSQQQARLLRLMASKAVIHGREDRYINEWLRRARALNPADRRGALLVVMYNVSPLLCKLLLRVKTRHQTDPLSIPPFADLSKAYS